MREKRRPHHHGDHAHISAALSGFFPHEEVIYLSTMITELLDWGGRQCSEMLAAARGCRSTRRSLRVRKGGSESEAVRYVARFGISNENLTHDLRVRWLLPFSW